MFILRRYFAQSFTAIAIIEQECRSILQEQRRADADGGVCNVMAQLTLDCIQHRWSGGCGGGCGCGCGVGVGLSAASAAAAVVGGGSVDAVAVTAISQPPTGAISCAYSRTPPERAHASWLRCITGS
jgi:hypothetical protein